MASTGQLPQGTDQVDIGSVAFARRLANLLLATRRERRLSLRRLARHSDGTFSHRDLRAWEAGERRPDVPTVLQLTGLYGCDVSAILPARLPVSVEFGRITAGGIGAPFEPLSSTSLLEAYLRLVRTLRRQKNAPTVELRRDDIEVLAAYLHESGEIVVERLGALMGATRGQRTAMAGLFATGAVVIGLVGTAAAGAPAPAPGTGDDLVDGRSGSTVGLVVADRHETMAKAPAGILPVIVVADDADPVASATRDQADADAATTPVADAASSDAQVPLVETDLFDQASQEPLVEVGLPPIP